MKFSEELSQYLSNTKEIININEKINELNIKLYFSENAVDIMRFSTMIMPFIKNSNYQTLDSTFGGICDKIPLLTIDNIYYLIFTGNIIVIIDDIHYYTFNMNFRVKRLPQESKVDPINLYSSSDGLVENIADNINLLRGRLKTKNVIVDKLNLGSSSQTDVAIIYDEQGVDKKQLNLTKKVLATFDSKYLTNIGQLNYLFSNDKLIPTTVLSGSAETISNAIIMNKIVILSDQSPIALILPATLTYMMTMKDEFSAPVYYTLFNRILLFLFIFIALFLPGLFISLLNFHSENLSMPLISIIKVTEYGTIIPTFYAILLLLVFFEFFQQALSRSPYNYVQNFIVVFGGLFIGQNAITTGLVGEAILLMTSLSYLSTYAVTNNPYILLTFNIARISILIASQFFGLVGFIGISMIIIIYLYNLKSLNVNYLSPIIPFNKKKFKEFIKPLERMKK